MGFVRVVELDLVNRPIKVDAAKALAQERCLRRHMVTMLDAKFRHVEHRFGLGQRIFGLACPRLEAPASRDCENDDGRPWYFRWPLDNPDR